MTICTEGRENLFGSIVDSKVVLNELGEIVKREWEKSGEIRASVELDKFVIMPNHIHGIIILNDISNDQYGGAEGHPEATKVVGADGNPPAPSDTRILGARTESTYPRTVPVSTVVAAFKRASTKSINDQRGTRGDSVWQRGFFDRIIRNEHEMGLARQYIVDNPMNWELDSNNSDHRGDFWEE